MISHLWVLKCYESKKLYDIIIHFYSIKINLYSMKYIFIVSIFFTIYKYIFIQSNKFVFNEIFLYYVFFHIMKIYFYSIKITLHSIRNIFTIYIFFIQGKYIFYYINFSFITFLVRISGLLQKSEFYIQYVNWTAARGCKKAAERSIRILCGES